MSQIDVEELSDELTEYNDLSPRTKKVIAQKKKIEKETIKEWKSKKISKSDLDILIKAK